jgi:hypothetical protein
MGRALRNTEQKIGGWGYQGGLGNTISVVLSVGLALFVGMSTSMMGMGWRRGSLLEACCVASCWEEKSFQTGGLYFW